MGFFSPKKKEDKKSEQIKDALVKIPILREKITLSSDLGKDSEKVFRLIRETLTKLYSLNHSFTYEELKEETRRKRLTKDEKDRIVSLCEKMIKCEFVTNSLSSQDVLGIMDIFEAILELYRPKIVFGKIFEKQKKEIVLPEIPTPPPLLEAESQSASFSLFKDKEPNLPEPPKLASDSEPPKILDLPPIQEEDFQTRKEPPINVREKKIRATKKDKEVKKKEIKKIDAEKAAPKQEPQELSEENAMVASTDFPLPEVTSETHSLEKPLWDDMDLPPLPGKDKKEPSTEKKGFKNLFGFLSRKKDEPKLGEPLMDDDEQYKPQGLAAESPKLDAEPPMMEGDFEPKTITSPPKPSPRTKTVSKKSKKVETLPSFTVESKDFEYRKDNIRKSLTDILQGISTSKQTINKEYDFLKEKAALLKKEKSNISQLTKSTDKKLPRLGRFEVEIKERENEVNKQLKGLKVRTDDLSKKELMLKEIDRQVSNIKFTEDSQKLEIREKNLEIKEQMVYRIQEDLKKQSLLVQQQIDRFQKELKEKQDGFLKLQDYFRARENKMSVEETNLLDQTKKNVKLIENHLQIHKSIILKDIRKTEAILNEKIARFTAIKDKHAEYSGKMSAMDLQAREYEKLLKEKNAYFKKCEDELNKKNLLIESAFSELEVRETKLIQREKQAESIRIRLETLDEKVKRKQKELETREIDVWNFEKRSDNLKLIINDKEREIAKKDVKLQQDIDKYRRLKRDIERGLRKKKYEIEKTQREIGNLQTKTKQLKEVTDRFEEGIKYLGGEIYGVEYDVVGDELKVSDITIEKEHHSPISIGSPQLIEIFRRLNIAKIALKKGHTEEAKRIYQDLDTLYKQLPAQEKDDAYGEISRIFARLIREEVVLTNEPSNIDTLLLKFNESLGKDATSSTEIYHKIQDAYSLLPDEDKTKYYPKLMEIYNQFLGQQVHTGIGVY